MLGYVLNDTSLGITDYGYFYESHGNCGNYGKKNTVKSRK